MKLSSVLILLLINFFSPQHIPRGVENPQSGLTIEIMSTTSQKEAADLTEQLRAKVVDAYWIAVTAPGQETSYRVRIGWYGSNFAARRSADLWRSEGLFQTYVIKAWEPQNAVQPTNNSSGNTVTNKGNDGAKAEVVSQSTPALSTKANVAPELIVQAGHSSDVKSVAFSRDGKLLASGGADKAIKLWEVSSGRELRTFIGHTASINSVAFSPDGNRIVSASEDQTVRVWDTRTGSETHSLKGRFDPNVQVAFSPDGKQLASTSGTVHLWNAQTGAEVKRLADYSLTAVAYSPNGKYLAGTINQTGYQPERIVLWNAQTGTEVRAFTGHYLPITSVAFSLDSRFMVSATRDTIKVWEVETGKELKTFTQRSGSITSVTFSPDGKRIASGSMSTPTIKLWEVETGAERTLEGHYFWVYSLAFSPDGKQLASGSKDSTIKLWDANMLVKKTLGGASSSITSMAISPDGKFIAVGTSWELDTNRKGYATKLWNTETGGLIRSLEHSVYVTSVAFSPNSKYLAVGSRGDGIRLWEAEAGERFRTLPPQGMGLFESILFSQDSKMLFGGGGESGINITMLDVESGQIIPTSAEYDDAVYSMTPLPNGKQLATGGRGKVILRDASTGRKIKEFAAQHFSEKIYSVACSPDGLMLAGATGSDYQGNIYLWNVNSGQLLKSVIRPSSVFSTERNSFHSIAFSPDGQLIVAGGGDATLTLLDAKTGKELRILKGHAGPVKTVAFLSDGKHIISGSLDRKTKIWEVATGKELLTGIALDEGNWAVVTPEGQFDTNKLDDPQGLHWLLPDAPFTPASFEVFMRDYYEPRLLSRILAGETLKPVRNLQSLNRVQPGVSNIRVSAPDTTGVVTVTLDIANQTSDSQRDATGKLLTSGVYDVRLFRDGQLVGYTTTEDAPLDATDERSLAVWRKANEVPLINGKKTLSFRVSLPRIVGKPFVEFSAYAFNMDRVKSDTIRTDYKIPVTLTPVKGRAYIITLSTNAYENPALNLRFAANDGRQVQRELVKRLLARGEYSEVVGIPLLSDYEIRRGTRVIPALDASAEDLRLGQQTVTEKSATKANFKAVLSLLAGKSVPTTQLAGIPNVEKLRAARPEDVIIVHVSGHGYSDDAGRFFLVPYDSGTGTLSALLTRSISSDELSWWLRDIDAGDLTLIADACQSAAAVAGQGFKPGPMGSRGLGQLAYDKGMRVLAATQADNVALGHGSIKQGLLTYALMHEGLELGMADYKPVDKTILLSEWLVYATERVPQLFEDILRGQMRSRSQFGQLATTTAEAKILVYPQGSSTEQRILLQGKPLGTSKTVSAEGQIQRPALFDFARQRRDVILMR